MAAGDLSPAQTRFRDRLVAATGLDPVVVPAWIGAESGWGTVKPGHNYLNVGPGRRYSDPDDAAAATAGLINTSGHYARVRAHQGKPQLQVAAIAASPWDAAHYTDEKGRKGGKLMRVYDQLTGGDGTGWLDNLTIDPNPFDDVVPKPNLVAGNFGGELLDTDKWLAMGLTLLFVLAGLGLVVLGVHRFVNGGPK